VRLGQGHFRITSSGTVAIQIRSQNSGSDAVIQPDSLFVLGKKSWLIINILCIKKGQAQRLTFKNS